MANLPGAAPPPGETVWIVDGDNVVHRLFHAIPVAAHLTPKGDRPINAVVGWVQHLRRLRTKRDAKYIVPVFDGHGRGWRHEICESYKANRPPHPPELDEQWPLIYGVTEALQLPAIRVETVEADDLIASYVEAACALDLDVVVISNDKDLMQLVRGDEGRPGSVRQLVKRDMVGPAEVRERFGVVGPELLGDFLALAGDTTDSIPGVRGIGPVKAAEILRDHGSLERALDRWSLVPGAAARKLRDGAEDARLSRRLVSLRSDLELPVPIERLRPWRPSRAALDAFFAPMGYPRFEAAVDPYP